MTDYIQVVTTTETRDDAGKIAAAVVQKRLAACAQVLGPIRSTYWWNGQVERADEWLCVMKSRHDRFADVEKAIRAIHAYDVPEIVAVPIVAGSRDYLDWINTETQEQE